jgi:DinB superfamily
MTNPEVGSRASRLAASRAAIAALQPRVTAGEPWPLSADAGHGPEAAWGPRESLAHLAEMLPYWLGEYERLVEAGRSPGDGLPFGRVASDPVRIGILERDRTVPLAELFARIDLWIERWEHRLAAARAGEGSAVGLHPSRGEMTADALVERMILAHLEEHLDQLEGILGAG